MTCREIGEGLFPDKEIPLLRSIFRTIADGEEFSISICIVIFGVA